MRPRSVRGSNARCPTNALARLQRASWEGASAGPTKPEQHSNKKSYGKIQGSAKKGCDDISETPGGLARRHDGPPVDVETDLRQEHRIT